MENVTEKENLIPAVCVVTDVRADTPDVKTFRVVNPEGKKPFEHKPGQCAMVSFRRGRVHVFDHFFAHERRIYGIFH